MSRILRSSAVTWAVGYVLLGLGALVAFAATLLYAWNVTVADTRAEILRDDAERLTEVFRRQGVDGLTAFMNTRIGMQIAGERILLLTDAMHHRLAGNLPAWPEGIPEKPGPEPVMLNINDRPTRAVLVLETLGDGYHLLVGRDMAGWKPLERRFYYGLTAAVLFLLLFGVAGGILIRRELLTKVDNIGQTVSAIMQGNLRSRLPVRDSGDELDTLARTINGMLDHIEHLIRGISGVSNAIAHDLRTPLAELRSRLEELAVTRPSADETFAEIEGAVADVDRVIRIFNALLRLAEIDSGVRRSGFVAVDAAQVAAEAVEFYLPAAELKGVALASENSSPVPVSGDPLLLAQAIGNRSDNALKYTPDNGRVAVG